MGEDRAGWLESGMGLEGMRWCFRTWRCLRADGLSELRWRRANSLRLWCYLFWEKRWGGESAGDVRVDWFWCTDLLDELGEGDGGWIRDVCFLDGLRHS